MMHSEPMWPVKGEYQCRTCLRKFRVAWEEPAATHSIPNQKAATGAETMVTAQSL